MPQHLLGDVMRAIRRASLPLMTCHTNVERRPDDILLSMQMTLISPTEATEGLQEVVARFGGQVDLAESNPAAGTWWVTGIRIGAPIPAQGQQPTSS